MSTPTLLPCTPYSDVASMRECPPFDVEGFVEDEVLEAALEVASRVMYLATGRQFHGECSELNVRPCGCSTCGLVQDMGWGIIRWPGVSDCGGSCQGRQCSCTRVNQVYLGLEPLATVTAVRVDGVALAPTAYRVDDWRWLVRTDGQSWPTCQDMSAADNAVGSWGVDVEWGLPASPLVVAGTEALAGEIAKGCAGAACGLPRRSIQSINRAGLQITTLDPLEFLVKLPGKPYTTGVYEADLAIVMENPGGVSASATFINPDDYTGNARRVGT